MRLMNKRNIGGVDENPFAMSMGDLMSALLFVFILILTSSMLKVSEQEAKDKRITENYKEVKTNLHSNLRGEFIGDLGRWNAIMDSTDLLIRFQEPTTLFDFNSSSLKPKFEDILSDFFPRYIETLMKPQFRKHIVEIRIEGHTDSKGGYIYNMKLSQDRTRSVLSYCLNQLSDDELEWASELITANGLSSSQLIYDMAGNEDESKSRRVEFRIRTDAERQLEKIAKERM